MNDQRNTWLGVPDLPDAPNPPRDLEGEQRDNMKAALTRDGSWGELEFWDWLDKLDERTQS